MNIKFNKKFFVILVVLAFVISGIVVGLILGLKVKQITGAVVSNGAGCAAIGGEMLNDGGSAVDAAIATMLCEGIILPQSMGIGGGFVATIYTKSTGKIETVIARESAPAAANSTMFVGWDEITGAISGAVPGELLGYYEMHKKYGRLPWSVLFKPSIKLCKEGYYVSQFLDRVLREKEKQVRGEPSLSEIFVKADGTLYKEGDHMKRPQLGKTLEIIAEKGVGELYDGGEIARMFTEDVQAMGGIITVQDLKDYRVRWEDKNHVTAKLPGGFSLYTTPLPTSGTVLAFIINVMNGLYTDNRNIYYQRLIETFKHAYGHRTNLGDLLKEPHMAPTINETFNNMISHDYAKYIRTLIHDDKTFEDYQYYGANFTTEEDHGTANAAVLASNGDAVTITSTINNYLGGKVRSKRTGIIVNDEMDDFATPGVVNSFGVPSSPANYIRPGKIPMSSMCPSIILDKDGNVHMLVGAAGGTKITTSVAMAIIKYVIFNETISEAVDDGRFHHQLAPMHVDVEADVSENIKNFITSIGHKINILQPGSSFAALTAIGVRTVPEPYFDRRRLGSIVTISLKNKMQH